jgi:hypothetical protein
MSYPITVLPDAELSLLQYLRALSIVTDLVPAERITTALPPKPVYPHVTIKRVGGTAVAWQRVDSAALQLDVWGGSRKECQDIARTIRAAILAIYGDKVDEANLVSASEEVGLQWIPDTLTVPALPRYVGRFQVLLHK